MARACTARRFIRPLRARGSRRPLATLAYGGGVHACAHSPLLGAERCFGADARAAAGDAGRHFCISGVAEALSGGGAVVALFVLDVEKMSKVAQQKEREVRTSEEVAIF